MDPDGHRAHRHRVGRGQRWGLLVDVSGAPSLLGRRVLAGYPSAARRKRRSRLLTGYAGWGAGQLDAELSSSAWLTTEADPEIIFSTQPAEMWETTIRRLGADPSLLQMGGESVH